MSADGEDRKFYRLRYPQRQDESDKLLAPPHSAWVAKRASDQKWIVGNKKSRPRIIKDFSHITFPEEVDRKTIKLIKTGVFLLPGRILESLPHQWENK